jgi:hypothetical protein
MAKGSEADPTNNDDGRSNESEFNPNAAYNAFPTNTDRGLNRIVRINDRNLFTSEALEDPLLGPVLEEFLEAPFIVYYAQFKSSSRQAEWFLHKPRIALDPHRSPQVGIEFADGLARDMPPLDRLQTLVMDHQKTLAHHSIRTMGIIETQSDAAQIIHKEEPNAHAEDDDLEVGL